MIKRRKKYFPTLSILQQKEGAQTRPLAPEVILRVRRRRAGPVLLFMCEKSARLRRDSGAR